MGRQIVECQYCRQHQCRHFVNERFCQSHGILNCNFSLFSLRRLYCTVFSSGWATDRHSRLLLTHDCIRSFTIIWALLLHKIVYYYGLVVVSSYYFVTFCLRLDWCTNAFMHNTKWLTELEVNGPNQTISTLRFGVVPWIYSGRLRKMGSEFITLMEVWSIGFLSWSRTLFS